MYEANVDNTIMFIIKCLLFNADHEWAEHYFDMVVVSTQSNVFPYSSETFFLGRGILFS